MWKRFLAWRKAKVRCWGRDTYIRFTPNVGFSFPWFKNKKRGRRQRIRAAWHHGVQITEWRGARWVVVKQVLGRSKVNREAFDLERKY